MPKTVLDVGGNVGQFAIASAKLFKVIQVYSFEPVPELVESLRKNVARFGNVTVYPIALGDRAGEMTFHVNSHSHSSSALSLTQAHRDAFPDAQEIETISVRVSTLDKVFENIEFKCPVLLKLDVQGYEAKTLHGGIETLKRIDYVLLETSFRPMYEGESIFRDLLKIMESQDFRFARPVGWLTAPSNGEVIQMDALFVRS
ncbi:MAG: FkbM family methyltransferase [Planctomycetota bacterium]